MNRVFLSSSLRSIILAASDLINGHAVEQYDMLRAAASGRTCYVDNNRVTVADRDELVRLLKAGLEGAPTHATDIINRALTDLATA